MPHHLTLIVKPTSACPAKCRYCYAYKPGLHQSRMRPDVLRMLMDRLVEFGRSRDMARATFIWHGGEPLLLGSDFYRTVMNVQADTLRAAGVDVVNLMQSNLLLLTPRLADVLRDFLVDGSGAPTNIGTSIDPIPGIRVFPGHDYEAVWLDKAQLAVDHGLKIGVVYTVHRKSLTRVDEIYDYLLHRVPTLSGVRFNPMAKGGRASTSAAHGMEITALEWGEFLVALHRCWQDDGGVADVQPLKEQIEYHLNGDFKLCCSSHGKCSRHYFGINHDGSVYSCGRGIGEGSLKYGNIMDQSLLEMYHDDHHARFENRQIQLRLTTCRDCRWWRYCHGGCPLDPILEGRPWYERTHLCEGNRHYFETVLAPLAPPRAMHEMASGESQ